jgi:hypothetical protein
MVHEVRDAPTCADGQRRLEALLAQPQAMVPDAWRWLADATPAR